MAAFLLCFRSTVEGPDIAIVASHKKRLNCCLEAGRSCQGSWACFVNLQAMAVLFVWCSLLSSWHPRCCFTCQQAC